MNDAAQHYNFAVRHYCRARIVCNKPSSHWPNSLKTYVYLVMIQMASPGIDKTAFDISSERHRQSGVNEFALASKRQQVDSVTSPLDQQYGVPLLPTMYHNYVTN